jgi:hypothetical protein
MWRGSASILADCGAGFSRVVARAAETLELMYIAGLRDRVVVKIMDGDDRM